MDVSSELSSDHSPLLIRMHNRVINKEQRCTLHNRRTNWDAFRELVEATINIHIALKEPNDIILAVEHFIDVTQQAAWDATPPRSAAEQQQVVPLAIRDKLLEKRRLRKRWQQHRSPELKAKLNKAIKELKKLLYLEKNAGIQEFLRNLSPSAASDYTLWKATKKLKQPQQAAPPISKQDGTWARTDQEKADTFAEHLTRVFTPNPREVSTEEEGGILDQLRIP